MKIYSDDHFMEIAYKEAVKAMEADEVPVGAVITSQNRVIARAHNQVETLKDTTAHAEILAITSASAFLGAKYLNECTLFVTIEPCMMCAGALRWSQIGRIVYAAEDPKCGFMRYGKEIIHPKTKLEFGILKEKCLKLVKIFFAQKRNTPTMMHDDL